MNIGLQILFGVSALGAFNGIVLGVYLLLNKKGRSAAAFFLSILLLTISIRVAKSVFLYFNPQLPKIYLQIGLSACFLIGPSLYYFLRSAPGQVNSIPPSWKRSWAILLGILVVGGILLPYQIYPWAWNHLVVYLIYLQWLAYLVAAGYLLRNVWKTFFIAASSLTTTQKFRLLMYSGNCIIFLFYLLALFDIVPGTYIAGPVSFSLILYLTIFFYLYGVRLESSSAPPETGRSGKAERRKIAVNDALLWSEKLEKIIVEQELFKDPNLKLGHLAQKINISAHQLSQLLNDNLGKSFSTYINEYRIKEACKLITTNDRLTFEAIGYEVGYNSKSTFFATFKKIKDTTPALFKESLEKNNSA